MSFNDLHRLRNNDQALEVAFIINGDLTPIYKDPIKILSAPIPYNFLRNL
jgi:hypothetical protein